MYDASYNMIFTMHQGAYSRKLAQVRGYVYTVTTMTQSDRFRRPVIIDLKLPAAIGCLFCGSLITVIGLGVWKPDMFLPVIDGGISGRQNNVTYADFIAVMLTALGVMITLLAVFIAVLAFLGYRQMLKMAEIKALAAASGIIDKSLKPEGILHQRVQLSLKENGELYKVFVSTMGSGQLNSILMESALAGVTQWDSSGEGDPADSSYEREE